MRPGGVLPFRADWIGRWVKFAFCNLPANFRTEIFGAGTGRGDSESLSEPA